MSKLALTFKLASEEWEVKQIHHLNYKTFVEEISQHEPNPEHTLVDKFHHENTYVICLHGHQLVGMVALRAKRPFSLDGKLENLDSYLPAHRSVCELRLLAVEKDYRHPRVFHGLILYLAQCAESLGYDLALISGTVMQLRLYRHLGFLPFGPLVGTNTAKFQPMYLTLKAYEALRARSDAFPADWNDRETA